MKKPKTHGEFFLEIGCEEIPAWMIPKALQEIKVLLEKYLGVAGLLGSSPVRVQGGPRRLTAGIETLLLRQPDIEKEIAGPMKSVAYDSAGAPTKAAHGFAAKQGVLVERLFIRSTPRGDQVVAKLVTPGRPAADLLRECLPRVIQEIPWPKHMRWSAPGDPKFIRPVRWIVGLLDGRVVPFSFGGVPAGNKSQGHRFIGKTGVAVAGMEDYRKKLSASFVLVDAAERKEKIERECKLLALKRGVSIHPDSDLLEKVVYLNEYPTAILGDFDPGFLSLPREVLITVMRGHQKYFAVEEAAGKKAAKKESALAPHFVAIINLDRDRTGEIRHGHERVLRARFVDARFFWEADLKCRRADIFKKLEAVVYESKLGSYAAKVERMRSIAGWLARQWAAVDPAVLPGKTPLPVSPQAIDTAAALSKCDLVSNLVREFPELQGVVGGLLARQQGESEEIADAIYDHYRPASLEDEIPRNLTGCTVALADRFDALAGCFAVGKIPSGSSDPFALRRAATGIVKILLERRLPLSLQTAVHASFQILHRHIESLRANAALERQLNEFFLDRARFVFQQRMGFAYDEINAVFASSAGGADDLVDAAERLAAVKALRLTTNFEPLAASFKRIRNIIEKAGPPQTWRADQVNPALFTEEAEVALHAAAGEVAREAAEHKQTRHYREALVRISSLRPAVDRFFDDVLVMAEDEAIRKNRLTLLDGLLKEFSTIADFSEIATEKK